MPSACGRSSAARSPRGCLAAPPEVVSSVPVSRSVSRAPPPPPPLSPWGAVLLHLHLLLGQALWWRAAARAMRTVCCSCRIIATRRWSPAALIHPLATTLHQKKRVVEGFRGKKNTPCLSSVVPTCSQFGGRTRGSKLPASPPPLPRPNGVGQPRPCACAQGPTSAVQLTSLHGDIRNCR